MSRRPALWISPKVCARLADLIRAKGPRILTGVKGTDLKETVGEAVVKTTGGQFRPRYIINCVGLHSHRVASMSAGSLSARIIPFRGESDKLTPEAEKFCNTLIYTVPDPRFAFGRVHFTRKISEESAKNQRFRRGTKSV